MGQMLLDPPSVEGWHTGEEWITSGSLVERVNFITNHLGNDSNPGVRDMVSRVANSDIDHLTPVGLVDKCIEVLGSISVSENTREELISIASITLEEKTDKTQVSRETILQLFKLIGSSREYQLC